MLEVYNRILDRYAAAKKELENLYCNKIFVVLLIISYVILIGILLALSIGQYTDKKNLSIFIICQKC